MNLEQEERKRNEEHAARLNEKTSFSRLAFESARMGFLDFLRLLVTGTRLSPDLSSTGTSIFSENFSEGNNFPGFLNVFYDISAGASLVIGLFFPALILCIIGTPTLSTLIFLSHMSGFSFLLILSIGIAFSLVSSIYHAVKMFRSPKGSDLRAQHKLALSKQVLNLFVGLLLTGAVAALFATGVSSAGLGVVSAVAMIVILGILAARFIKRYRAYKAKQTLMKKERQLNIQNFLNQGKDVELVGSLDDKRIKNIEGASARLPKVGDVLINLSELFDKNVFPIFLENGCKQGLLKERLTRLIEYKINHLKQSVQPKSWALSIFTAQKLTSEIKALEFVKALIGNDANDSNTLHTLSSKLSSLRTVVTLFKETVNKVDSASFSRNSFSDHLSLIENALNMSLSENDLPNLNSLLLSVTQIRCQLSEGNFSKESLLNQLEQNFGFLYGQNLEEWLKTNFAEAYSSSQVRMIIEGVQQYADGLFSDEQMAPVVGKASALSC